MSCLNLARDLLPKPPDLPEEVLGRDTGREAGRGVGRDTGRGAGLEVEDLGRKAPAF